MLVGGVHTVIDMMETFPDDVDILENGCRALGSFAAYGNYKHLQTEFICYAGLNADQKVITKSGSVVEITDPRMEKGGILNSEIGQLIRVLGAVVRNDLGADVVVSPIP